MSQFRGRRSPEAENRARQIRGKLVWHRTAALGFGRLRRPRRPRPRGVVRTRREAHISGRRTHLKRRPPSRARGQAGQDGGTLNATRSAGRGWESQSRPLEERGRTTQRPRAEGQRTIQPTLGTTLALAPRRGGSGIGEAFVRRLRNPTRRRAALLGQRPSGDEYGDDSRTTPQKARRVGTGVIFSVVGPRERRGTLRPTLNPLSTSRRLLTHTSIAFLTPIIWKGASRRGRATAGDLQPFLKPPCSRAVARPVVASALRSVTNKVANSATAPAFWVGLRRSRH